MGSDFVAKYGKLFLKQIRVKASTRCRQYKPIVVDKIRWSLCLISNGSLHSLFVISVFGCSFKFKHLRLLRRQYLRAFPLL